MSGPGMHCPAGHPYVGGNLLLDSAGGRKCRTCANARKREQGRKRTLTQRKAQRIRQEGDPR